MDNRLERSKRIFIEQDYEKSINDKSLMYLDRYEVDMELRGLADSSIYNYKRDLMQWLAYVNKEQENKNLDEIEGEDIEMFVYYCRKQGNNGKRLQRRISSISAFYKFLRRKKYVKDDPTEFVARPKAGLPVVKKTFLTSEQVDNIRKHLRAEGDLQLEVYFEVSLSTMARVTALSNVKWGQVDFESLVIRNVLEKEGYIVDLYLTEDSADLLMELKKQREEEGIDIDNVFAVKHGGVYRGATDDNLRLWAKKIGNFIGEPELSPHDFRRSGATLRSNAGMPLEQISSLLNHKGMDVTKLYVKEDTERKGEQFRQYDI